MTTPARPVHHGAPDGRTGPWLRKPHKKDSLGLLIHDPRCPACQQKALDALKGGEK